MNSEMEQSIDYLKELQHQRDTNPLQEYKLTPPEPEVAAECEQCGVELHRGDLVFYYETDDVLFCDISCLKHYIHDRAWDCAEWEEKLIE